MFYKRIFTLSLALLLINGLLTACSNTGTPVISASNNAVSTTPYNDLPTLSYWFPMFPEVQSSFLDYNRTATRLDAEKLTGIHINWITPSVNNASEVFAVMLAGHDYPDLINYDRYPTGGDGAITDGVYLKLNDLIETYAPNYKSFLDRNPLYQKETLTDAGNRWAFYLLHAEDKTVTGGLVWREDIAKKLGWSEAPKTVADMDRFVNDCLDAGYKEFFSLPQYGFIPEFCGLLPPSFGASTVFMNVDGKVQFGPIVPGYKNYLTKMNEWYKKGIIDTNFASVTMPDSWSGIATGQYLVGVGVNGILGSFFSKNGVSDDPNCSVAAITPLAVDENTPCRSGNTVSFVINPTAVSTNCKSPDLAVRWLDFWYSAPGILLRNYGVEGDTFEMISGKPQYTELITNNPDGIPIPTALQAFCFTMGPGYSYTIYETKEVEIGGKVWSNYNPVWNMPLGITLTADESTLYNAIMNDVFTYCEENTARFISGTRSLDEFDAYITEIKSIGIEKAITIQQEALNRYLDR